MTFCQTRRRAAALLACLALCACAGRGGPLAEAVPAAREKPSPRAADAGPLADGIVPLTLEQARETE